MLITVDTSHLEILALNDGASQNMACMLVTFDTSHLEISLLNNLAPINIELISVTFETSHLDKSLSNDIADQKIARISVTLDTSHVDRLPLNFFTPMNKELISVMFDKSHSVIGPLKPFEQSEDSLRQRPMALLSIALDCGENTVVSVVLVVLHAVNERSSLDGIDPEESSNMLSLVAFELTQAAPQSCWLKDFADMNI